MMLIIFVFFSIIFSDTSISNTLSVGEFNEYIKDIKQDMRYFKEDIRNLKKEIEVNKKDIGEHEVFIGSTLLLRKKRHAEQKKTDSSVSKLAEASDVLSSDSVRGLVTDISLILVLLGKFFHSFNVNRKKGKG